MSHDLTPKLCDCGCGQPAGVYSSTQKGYVKGEPRRYILGHNPGPLRRNPPTIEERFWAKVQRGGPDECWPWTGALSDRGYGRFDVGGRLRMASHVSYEMHVGPIPAGLFACHSCDNPPCVNPAHLFPGDQKTNLADMVAKGRSLKGEDHFHAKLTEEAVRSMRARSTGERGEATRFAAEYGVSVANICYVLKGHTWTHV